MMVYAVSDIRTFTNLSFFQAEDGIRDIPRDWSSDVLFRSELNDDDDDDDYDDEDDESK